MKLALYIKAERSIAAADSSGIRERWLWGLRLLADPEKIAKGGGLRNGVTDQLIAAAAKRNIKLSQREIQYRLQVARVYSTEDQIAQILARFENWWSLIQAGFPQVDAAPNEPAADYRTKIERDHDRARALADLIDVQGSLFPLSQFEPIETTLADLAAYADEQEKITANFIRHGQERRGYLDTMINAVGGDLGQTWADAHRAAFGDEPGEPSGS